LPVIECRAAHFDELPMAAALRQEMGVEMGDDYDAQTPDWRTKFCLYFGGRSGVARAQVFLAFDKGQPIGCATISVLDDYRGYVFNKRSAFVNAVFVKPEYRRRGVARELMRMAIAWAHERGCIRVRLRSSEEGRALYASLGFDTGREMELHF
jgi:GNAT superfamily N-acetyltransferase